MGKNIIETRTKFKRYLRSKLKDCNIDEAIRILDEMGIAISEYRSELKREYVFCEHCKKHFLKTSCKENVVKEKDFVCDDDDDDNMFVKGRYIISTVLYRVCPICGKNDLYDKIITTRTEE